MSTEHSERERQPERRMGWKTWGGYVITFLLEAVLTLSLVLLDPHFPLRHHPMPYIILSMLIAYYLGTGPLIFSFALAALAIVYFLTPPRHVLWPLSNTVEGWTGIASFVLGVIAVGFIAALMRRARERVEQLAAELDRQKVLLETLTADLPAAVVFVDRDERLGFANSRAADLLGRPPHEISGRSLREFFGPSAASAIRDAVNNVLSAGAPVVWHDYRPDPGSERYFDIDFLPVREAENGIIGTGIMAVETTASVEERRELGRHYEHEHYIAEMLQTSLLSRPPKRLGRFDFETLYRAAWEEARVGGDFYDVFTISDHEAAIVIGDVSGKGLAAAAQVAMAKHSVRVWAYQSESPAAAMEKVNDTLMKEQDMESFVTMFLGFLDWQSGRLRYANGGHSPVMLWKSREQRVEMLERTGTVVGSIDGATYEDREQFLDSGDELLLSTDGLWEIRSSTGYLEIEDLTRIYAQMKREGVHSAPELVSRVFRSCGGNQQDDIAVLRVTAVE